MNFSFWIEFTSFAYTRRTAWNGRWVAAASARSFSHGRFFGRFFFGEKKMKILTRPMFIEIISIRLVSLKDLWEHFLGGRKQNPKRRTKHNFGLVRQRWNRPHTTGGYWNEAGRKSLPVNIFRPSDISGPFCLFFFFKKEIIKKIRILLI